MTQILQLYIVLENKKGRLKLRFLLLNTSY